MLRNSPFCNDSYSIQLHYVCTAKYLLNRSGREPVNDFILLDLPRLNPLPATEAQKSKVKPLKFSDKNLGCT